MPTIYIIAGCNGAGKSTSANVILPQFLNCKEFVNADSIAAGLSPFQPDTVSFQAGKIMLNRIKELIYQNATFAFETTLTTKSYINLLKNAKVKKYKIVMFYFWLNSVELALARIEDRVRKGGHNIPKDVVIRRYKRSLDNLVNLFMPICDNWSIFDNSSDTMSIIAKKKSLKETSFLIIKAGNRFMLTKTKMKKLSVTDKALKGGRKAIKNLIEERKKTNDYLVVSRNGKVVKVKARSLR